MTKPRRDFLLAILISLAITAAMVGVLWRSDPSDRERPKPVGVRVPSQVSLSGVVTNCYREPVTDAAIRVVLDSGDDRSTRVDEEGAFSFDGVPVGRYQLRVESETWGGLAETGTLNSGNHRRLRLSFPGRARVDGRIRGLAASEVRHLGPLRLFRFAGTTRKLVVGDVGVLRKEPDSATFTISGLGVGRFVLEAPTARGVFEREFEVESNGQVVALELTIPARSIEQGFIAVYGTAYITDKETTPLASRLLEVDVVRPGEVTREPSRQVYTDPQGAYRFRIRPLERGTILRYSYPQAEPVVAEIEEKLNEDVQFDPVFGIFPLEKVGILTTSDGVPVANSRLILNHNTRWSDDDGIFSLDEVGKGSHDIKVWYNSYGRLPASVKASLEISTGPSQPETVALEIDVANAICLQVLTYDGQRPGHGVVRYALAKPEAGVGREAYYKVQFRRPGRVFLADLPYDGVLHIATRGSHRPGEAGRPPVMPTYCEVEVHLEDLEPPKEVFLPLEGSRFASVQVVGADGAPVSGAFSVVGLSDVRPPAPPGIRFTKRLQTSHPYEALSRQSLVETRDKGVGSYDLFLFDGFEQPIQIYHPEGAAVITRSEGEALLSAAPPRTIRLGVEGFVAGTVQCSQGEPVSDCRVELRLARGETRSAETFPNGNYFLYAGDGVPEQLEVLPTDGNDVNIESPVAGVMEVIRLE